MTLDIQKTDSFIGQALLCRPYAGYGWGLRNSGIASEIDIFQDRVAPAGDFHLIVKDFFDMLGTRRGFYGRIEEQGHIFNGLMLVATTMSSGTFDFTDRLCMRYDVEIGEDLPGSIGGHVVQGYFGNVWVAATSSLLDQFVAETTKLE